mmetsp:Transcript_82157/g.175878  ORF Transcript_82157/g.175878 Transcript_82157/m.175878 type:complete len:219 (+) Transcript_82157:196-852(+)
MGISTSPLEGPCRWTLSPELLPWTRSTPPGPRRSPSTPLREVRSRTMRISQGGCRALMKSLSAPPHLRIMCSHASRPRTCRRVPPWRTTSFRASPLARDSRRARARGRGKGSQQHRSRCLGQPPTRLLASPESPRTRRRTRPRPLAYHSRRRLPMAEHTSAPLQQLRSHLRRWRRHTMLRPRLRRQASRAGRRSSKPRRRRRSRVPSARWLVGGRSAG